MENPPAWSRPSSFRKSAAAAVGLQAVLAGVWWAALLWIPALRPLFRPSDAPNATLLAFALPDVLLFAIAGLAAAIGLWHNVSWARPVLLLHAGAAIYAALYCIQLTVLTGEAQAAAVLMTPSLVILPTAIWSTRP